MNLSNRTSIGFLAMVSLKGAVVKVNILCYDQGAHKQTALASWHASWHASTLISCTSTLNYFIWEHLHNYYSRTISLKFLQFLG